MYTFDMSCPQRKIALLSLLTVMPAPAQQPKFDIADVHVSTTARTFGQNFGGVLRGGKYVNRDATMLDLIEAAYSVAEDGINGGPGWLSSDLFDVVAKIPDGTTPAAANLMLQALLADRFKLVIHHGTGPVPRYVLSVGKGGSKLKPASGSEDSGCQQQQQAGPAGGRGGPVDLASLPNAKVSCHNLTASAIAENLHQRAGAYFDHDVIDSTNLEGSWNFDLEWTGRGALAARGSGGISIFDAVDKQLGLKLELQNVPMPSLVIESVNRKPSGNPAGAAEALAIAPARFEAAAIKPADPDHPGVSGLIYTGGSETLPAAAWSVTRGQAIYFQHRLEPVLTYLTCCNPRSHRPVQSGSAGGGALRRLCGHARLFARRPQPGLARN